jgi:FlaA1/EpsC-like NDP-sugar epimerase
MTSLFKQKRIAKTFELMVLDAFFIFASYAFTYMALRFLDIDLAIGQLFMLVPIIIAFKLIVFYSFGVYKMLLTHFGLEDMVKLASLVLGTNLVLFLVFLVLGGIQFHPVLLVFIGLMEVFLIGGLRGLSRILNVFRNNLLWRNYVGKKTLIVGAGDGGERVMKEIYRNNKLNNLPLCFVDDNEMKHGTKLMGIPIVGNSKDLPFYIDQFNIEEVIIAIANMKSKELRRIINIVSEKNVSVKRLPLMEEMDKHHPYKIVDVNLEDLLNREKIELDNKGIKEFVKGETVLVTGGGGSIGGELSRQIIKFKPKKLIIFDIYENNAYDIQMELNHLIDEEKLSTKLFVRIGSVYNKVRLEKIFKEFGPTKVFHVAAYKHVPLMEDSPEEAIRTNVVGTDNAASLSDQYGVKDFVLVSSDKAVRPTNVMGATKRFAELIIQKHQKGNPNIKYSAVRFGNVLGSNGSVIPLFKKQLAYGGPITVTHPDITRYFMTIPEAVSLILQSAVYAEGGELFILDMGEAVKIKSLAEKMVRLSGLKPYDDIDIVFTGLRPGEKLYEELLLKEDDNSIKRTNSDKIYIECSTCHNDDSISKRDVLSDIDGIWNKSPEAIKTFLNTYIKSYKVN